MVAVVSCAENGADGSPYTVGIYASWRWAFLDAAPPLSGCINELRNIFAAMFARTCPRRSRPIITVPARRISL